MGLFSRYASWYRDRSVTVYVAFSESGKILGIFTSLKKAEAASRLPVVSYIVDGPDFGSTIWQRRA